MLVIFLKFIKWLIFIWNIFTWSYLECKFYFKNCIYILLQLELQVLDILNEELVAECKKNLESANKYLYSNCHSIVKNFLSKKPFQEFVESMYFLRYLQWKDLERYVMADYCICVCIYILLIICQSVTQVNIDFSISFIGYYLLWYLFYLFSICVNV